jgi:hypothetical protein
MYLHNPHNTSTPSSWSILHSSLIFLMDILPRLLRHTRILLSALNGAWKTKLDAIGVQGKNGLNPRGQRIAELTRLK